MSQAIKDLWKFVWGMFGRANETGVQQTVFKVALKRKKSDKVNVFGN